MLFPLGGTSSRLDRRRDRRPYLCPIPPGRLGGLSFDNLTIATWKVKAEDGQNLDINSTFPVG